MNIIELFKVGDRSIKLLHPRLLNQINKNQLQNLDSQTKSSNNFNPKLLAKNLNI